MLCYYSSRDAEALLDKLDEGYSGNGELRAAAAMGGAFTWNLCVYLSRHDIAMPAPPSNVGEGKIIAAVPFQHPDDFKFLQYVLVEYPGKFVSWIHNSTDGGFHEGHYTEIGYGDEVNDESQAVLRAAAIRAFTGRVGR